MVGAHSRLGGVSSSAARGHTLRPLKLNSETTHGSEIYCKTKKYRNPRAACRTGRRCTVPFIITPRSAPTPRVCPRPGRGCGLQRGSRSVEHRFLYGARGKVRSGRSLRQQRQWGKKNKKQKHPAAATTMEVGIVDKALSDGRRKLSAQTAEPKASFPLPHTHSRLALTHCVSSSNTLHPPLPRGRRGEQKQEWVRLGCGKQKKEKNREERSSWYVDFLCPVCQITLLHFLRTRDGEGRNVSPSLPHLLLHDHSQIK